MVAFYGGIHWLSNMLETFLEHKPTHKCIYSICLMYEPLKDPFRLKLLHFGPNIQGAVYRPLSFYKTLSRHTRFMFRQQKCKQVQRMITTYTGVALLGAAPSRGHPL